MPRGRPRKKYEIKAEDLVMKLAQLGLKNTTIAEVTGIDDTTLKRNFEKYLTKGRKNLKNDISAKQVELALRGKNGEGSAIMLIWLGKNLLGQTDKVEKSGEINLVIERKKVKGRNN